MAIPGNLLTTAMAVMPHTDVQRALDAALSLDIPFWPQLPNYSYYEDMYVQASEHFPGICLDLNNRKLSFSTDKFIAELEETLAQSQVARVQSDLISARNSVALAENALKVLLGDDFQGSVGIALEPSDPLVVVPEAVVTRIWDAIDADPTTEITVDMERRVVEVPSIGLVEPFPMDDATQHRFLNGLDDIGLTLALAEEIDTYEARRPAWLAQR